MADAASLEAITPVLAAVKAMSHSTDRQQKAQAMQSLDKFQKTVRCCPGQEQ